MQRGIGSLHGSRADGSMGKPFIVTRVGLSARYYGRFTNEEDRTRGRLANQSWLFRPE